MDNSAGSAKQISKAESETKHYESYEQSCLSEDEKAPVPLNPSQARLSGYRYIVAMFSRDVIKNFDRVQHYRYIVETRTDELKSELKHLRTSNPDIRPVGLRGTDARKQEALGLKYKKPSELTADDRDRMIEIHKTDYTIRNKLDGLDILKDILKREAFILDKGIKMCHESKDAIDAWQDDQPEEAIRLFMANIENNVSIAGLKMTEVSEMLEVLALQF